jgi:ferredoxin-type protein NapH
MTLTTDVLIVVISAALAVVGFFCILKLTKNKTRNVSTLRIYVQVVAVVFVFMGLILGPFGTPLWAPLGPAPRDRLVGGNIFGTQFPDGLSVPILACYYPSGRTVTCPIWQIQAYIFPFWNTGIGYGVYYSTSGLEKLGIAFASIIVMSLVLGRFFCGWLCPFGLYMDMMIRLRKFSRKRHLSFSDKTNKVIRQSRYIIIATFLVLSVIFGSQAIFGARLVPGTQLGGPQGTEAGLVSYLNEPFCLVCPARPLCVLAECALGYMKSSYVFQITYGPLYSLGFYVTSINLAVLILITVLAFAYRRFWCRICPLGGLTALFSTFTPFQQVALTRLTKDEDKCTKCGVCKRVCPTQVTEIFDQKGGDVTVSGCMLCFRCVEMCPYPNTLKARVAGKTVFKSRNWLENPQVKQENQLE